MLFCLLPLALPALQGEASGAAATGVSSTAQMQAYVAHIEQGFGEVLRRLERKVEAVASLMDQASSGWGCARGFSLAMPNLQNLVCASGVQQGLCGQAQWRFLLNGEEQLGG